LHRLLAGQFTLAQMKKTKMATVTPPAKLRLDWIASGQPVVPGWRKCPTYDRGFFSTDRSRPIKELVQQKALAHTSHTPMIWNIEHWPVVSDQTKYVDIIEWAREVRPDLRQGLYSMCPTRNYWAPVELSIDPHNVQYKRRYADWLRINEHLRPLATALDLICPSLYTFYRNEDGHVPRQNEWWFIYAKANIDEARKYGKQVIPFLSPRLWRSDGQEPMAMAFFKQQVEFVLQHADGVVIFDWSGNRPTIDYTSVMRHALNTES